MDYGTDYDFSDWFGNDYGSDYTPMEGSSVGSGADEGGTFGDWSGGNYDYTYGNTSDYGNDFYNNSNYATDNGWGGSGGVDLSNPSYNYSGDGLTQAPQTAGSSIMPYLQNLFNNPNAVGMAGKGIAALFEGYQNKKKAAAMQKLATSTALDPFGSQREFYQQQAKQAVTDPYSSPIVQAQIKQLQNAQNIKDAAAGRRSNTLTSSPAVMAQMAQIAQAYQQQMAQQGGSNIAPSSGLAQILQSGSNADTNGYISPLMNLLGNYTQAQKNAAAMG